MPAGIGSTILLSIVPTQGQSNAVKGVFLPCVKPFLVPLWPNIFLSFVDEIDKLIWAPDSSHLTVEEMYNDTWEDNQLVEMPFGARSKGCVITFAAPVVFGDA